MKKWIAIILVAVLLIVAGLLGYRAWYRNTHVFVEGTAYEKDLTELDLRGTGVSIAYYGQARQLLPDCRIRYDLPFQGAFYPDDTTELTISSLSAEEVELLDYLPALKTVNADGCTDYEQMLALQVRRPDCDVHYVVMIDGEAYGEDTTRMSFQNEQPDIQELMEQLAWLPKMKEIFFEEPTAPAKELLALREAYPQIEISWNKTAFGVSYHSDVTEIDLTGMLMESPETIVEPLSYFPELEKVIMCECGPAQKVWFDDETMSAFREIMRSEYKVVWLLKIYGLKVRTDDLYFMPVKHGVVVSNFEIQKLRYCEDMLCVDIGHMAVTDLSFLEGMKSLKYFILVDSPLIYIEPIANCKNLVYVELFRTEVQDLSPLLECTSLQDLNVTRTKADPMVLKEMTWLNNLWVSKHQFDGNEMEEIQAAMPDTFIKFCDYNILSRNGWRNLQNYYDMRDLLGMPYNRW